MRHCPAAACNRCASARSCSASAVSPSRASATDKLKCNTALFGSIRNFFTIQSTYEKLLQHQGDLNQTTGLVKAFTDSALEMTRKSVEHRTPILIISLVGMALCLLGALWMRKLQKTGFYVYLIGELLPVVIGVFLLGMGSLGGVLIVPALLVPAVFIVLYATQVKFMR